MNILICSAGRRVKLVEFFKEELHRVNGKVIVVDCDPTAPALHYADEYEIVPRINHPEYIQHLKYLCEKFQIRAILSLIDPELSLLASCREVFERDGIQVIVSNHFVVNTCYDKYLTYKFLQENEIPAIPTYIDIKRVLQDLENNKIQFPLIVKPKNGSASLGIKKITTIEELGVYQGEANEFIVQPFLKGAEFGVDCYIDMVTNKTINMFLKRKISMRAGETDKSISIKDPLLTEVIEKLVLALKPIGPIDIDCFKTDEGYVVSEINPRFGGGYLHAHAVGQNFVKYIINNLQGVSNEGLNNDYQEGRTMVKFDHFLLL